MISDKNVFDVNHLFYGKQISFIPIKTLIQNKIFSVIDNPTPYGKLTIEFITLFQEGISQRKFIIVCYQKFLHLQLRVNKNGKHNYPCKILIGVTFIVFLFDVQRIINFVVFNINSFTEFYQQLYSCSNLDI